MVSVLSILKYKWSTILSLKTEQLLRTTKRKARVMAALMAFFTTLLLFLRSLSSYITNKFPEASPQHEQNIVEFGFDSISKEEFRPPTPSFTKAQMLSSVLKRLGELEEKVVTLEAKPSEMPDKKELLNVVYRVDALEAELIATKKTPYEALMKQEELLAYSDCQEEARFRVPHLFHFMDPSDPFLAIFFVIFVADNMICASYWHKKKFCF